MGNVHGRGRQQQQQQQQRAPDLLPASSCRLWRSWLASSHDQVGASRQLSLPRLWLQDISHNHACTQLLLLLLPPALAAHTRERCASLGCQVRVSGS